MRRLHSIAHESPFSELQRLMIHGLYTEYKGDYDTYRLQDGRLAVKEPNHDNRWSVIENSDDAKHFTNNYWYNRGVHFVNQGFPVDLSKIKLEKGF